MRNLLTLMALLLSSTGIFVSLAREELRCRLGLSSSECMSADRQFNPVNGSRISADPQANSSKKGLNATQPDRKSPIPSTAKLMETVDQLRETMTPKADPEAPSENTAPIAPAAPAQADSNLQPDIPVTSKESAVDAAIIGEPSPSKAIPDVAPIAPPAEKNHSNPHAIPVIPAQGVAIPVTPPTQE